MLGATISRQRQARFEAGKFTEATNPADNKRFIRLAGPLGLNALSHCRTQQEPGF